MADPNTIDPDVVYIVTFVEESPSPDTIAVCRSLQEAESILEQGVKLGGDCFITKFNLSTQSSEIVLYHYSPAIPEPKEFAVAPI